MKKEYLPIPGYFGYVISNDGTVISTRKSKPKELKHVILKTGYHMVNIYNIKPYGKRYLQSVANLVLLTWGPPKPSPKHKVDFIDCNRNNLQINNLRWVTQSEITGKMINRIKDSLQRKRRIPIVIFVEGIKAAEALVKYSINNKDSGTKNRKGFYVFSPEGFKNWTTENEIQ